MNPNNHYALYLTIKAKIKKEFPFLPEHEQRRLTDNRFDEYLASHTAPAPKSKQEKELEKIPSFDYPCQSQDFLLDLKRNYNKNTKALPFVPNHSHSITLDSWTKKQQKYYFYWRGQFRQGNYLETDETYYYLYCIELVYGIGYESPEKAFQDFITLLQAYVNEFPQFTNLFLSWIFDFALYHNIDMNIFCDQFPLTPPTYWRRNLMLYTLNNESFHFPPHFLEPLSDFSFTRCKLDRDLLRKATSDVINHLHQTVVVKKKKGFLDNFSTAQKKTEEVNLFDYMPEITIVKQFQTKNYLTNKRFLQNITEIHRLTENTLRGFAKIRGRLQNIQLEPEIQAIILQFLDEHYNPNYVPKIAPAPEKLSLDFQEINNLRDQSDAVRAALEVPEETAPPPKKPPQTKEKKKPSKKLDTLPEPWQNLIDALEEPEKQALLLLSTNPSPKEVLQQLAEDHFTMIEPLMEEINNHALEHLNDIILEMIEDSPVILEEYQNFVTQSLPLLSLA